MYLSQIKIRNVRSIRRFDMNFESDNYAGWHVIIGDNGAGKSTVVRSVALALAGPDEAPGLRQNWGEWLRLGEDKGSVRVDIEQDPQWDKATGRGPQLKKYYIDATVEFQQLENKTVQLRSPDECTARRYVWGAGDGWFCASFGPFRRFEGGDMNFEKLFYSSPHLAPHLSAFGENVALTEILSWLKQLDYRALENHEADKQVLHDLKTLINSGQMLPHKTTLESISSDGVFFRDGNGQLIGINQLSDGYRSVLSMTFELIRQLVINYGANAVFSKIRTGQIQIDLPGVVVIDEIDAHLHPAWQKRIGTWLCEFFPKLQFIVTTHSPLVCQAAAKGSVWRLPAPGGKRAGSRVTGEELERLLFGDLVEAYDTELFGIQSTRSEVGKEKLQRLAVLNTKARHQTLLPIEKKELQRLRASLPTVATAE